MTDLNKFLFDKDFDFEAELEAKARAEAERRTREPEPEPEPEPPAPTFSEEEVAAAREAARQEGWNAGFAAGEEQTRNQAEELLTATTARVAAGLDTLLAHAGETARRRDTEALAAAVRLVETLFPALAGRESMREIEALLSDSLNRLHEEPRVVVRVADPLLDTLRARMDAIAAKAGYPGQTILLADESIAEGDVRVEWADGGAERDTGRLWRDIRDMLAQATGGQTADGQTAASSGAGKAPPAEPANTPEDLGHAGAEDHRRSA